MRNNAVHSCLLCSHDIREGWVAWRERTLAGCGGGLKGMKRSELRQSRVCALFPSACSNSSHHLFVTGFEHMGVGTAGRGGKALGHGTRCSGLGTLGSALFPDRCLYSGKKFALLYLCNRRQAQFEPSLSGAPVQRFLRPSHALHPLVDRQLFEQFFHGM